MVIYGWRSKPLSEKSFTVKNSEGEDVSLIAVIVAKYFHIFWIPVVPYSKKMHVFDAAGKEHSQQAIPSRLQQEVNLFKKDTRMPVWMFAGLFLIAGLAGYITFDSHQNEVAREEMIQNPVANDVYAIYDTEETTEFKYSHIKVVDVTQDSIHLEYSSHSYNKVPGELLENDGFYPFSVAIARDSLKHMYANGVVKRVYRDWDESTGFSQTADISTLFDVSNEDGDAVEIIE